MEAWRFLDLEEADGYWNMAVDEAIAKARGEGKAPNTLRFYMWRPSAVIIGFFQSVEEEVDQEECKRQGIDIVRRMSGGGAVLNSSGGVFTYTIAIGGDDPRIAGDIVDSYRVLCRGLIEGLSILGLKGEFKPINDIVVGGRKISGNAQVRKYGIVLHHGTLLIDFDPHLMARVLRISEEKLRDKMLRGAEERVTTIRRELGRDVSLGEVRDAMLMGFRRALNVELVPGRLTEYEEGLARELRKKYSSPEWIYRR